MKLIVGLGNPEEKYDFSPHNLGFATVERLADRHSVRIARKQHHSVCGKFLVGGDEVWLIKPLTYMNVSGVAVKEWLAKEDCGPENLLVIADDLDLPWGSLRIREKGGAAGHHGLESIIDSIGTQQFTRLRIGVCPEQPIPDTIEYLLAPVRKALREQLDEILDRASDAVETILEMGSAKAMSRFNKRPPASEEGKNQKAD